VAHHVSSEIRSVQPNIDVYPLSRDTGFPVELDASQRFRIVVSGRVSKIGSADSIFEHLLYDIWVLQKLVLCIAPLCTTTTVARLFDDI